MGLIPIVPKQITRLLMGAVLVLALLSSSMASKGSNKSLLSRYRSFQQNEDSNSMRIVATDLSLLNDLRGGSKSSDEISLEDTSSSNPIMTKVRNVIRSVLKIGDKKVPTLSKSLRSILKSLETMIGVQLLPKASKKKKKSSKKKTEKYNNASATEDDQIKEDLEEKSKKEKPKLKQKPTAATKSHLMQKISSSNPNYRIQRELKDFIKDPPPNLSVKAGKNIRIWIVTMVGAKGSIYEGEVYKLRISFPAQYPTVPPSVYFLPPHIP